MPGMGMYLYTTTHAMLAMSSVMIVFVSMRSIFMFFTMVAYLLCFIVNVSVEPLMPSVGGFYIKGVVQKIFCTTPSLLLACVCKVYAHVDIYYARLVFFAWLYCYDVT